MSWLLVFSLHNLKDLRVLSQNRVNIVIVPADHFVVPSCPTGFFVIADPAIIMVVPVVTSHPYAVGPKVRLGKQVRLATAIVQATLIVARIL